MIFSARPSSMLHIRASANTGSEGKKYVLVAENPDSSGRV